jgi:hypothetical protein
MNKKQRVLTVIALIAFVVIGVCHYHVETHAVYPTGHSGYFVTTRWIEDLQTAWFMLGVIYVGYYGFVILRASRKIIAAQNCIIAHTTISI